MGDTWKTYCDYCDSEALQWSHGQISWKALTQRPVVGSLFQIFDLWFRGDFSPSSIEGFVVQTWGNLDMFDFLNIILSSYTLLYDDVVYLDIILVIEVS